MRFKFKGATAYAQTYGNILADCVRENLNGRYDLISWVPLSRSHLKARGYDQAMLLALSTALALDNVAVSTLENSAEDQDQLHYASAEERRKAMSGAYHVVDHELIEGKRILLIDDIISSGLTCSECAKTLLDGGACEVLCAAVAIARD